MSLSMVALMENVSMNTKWKKCANGSTMLIIKCLTFISSFVGLSVLVMMSITKHWCTEHDGVLTKKLFTGILTFLKLLGYMFIQAAVIWQMIVVLYLFFTV